MLRRSDIFLLMSNPDLARYMPGKMFEYMAAGKPILVYGHPGEASELVLALGAGVFVREGDVGGLLRALATLEHTPATAWNGERRRAWAEQHTRQRLARPFFELLQRVTTTEPPRRPS